MTVDISKLLTISQAAKRTPTMSEPTLRNWIEDGRLDAVRIGGHIFLSDEELRVKLGKLYQPRPA